MWQYLALLISVVIGILVLAIIWHVKHLVTDRDLYSVIPLKKMMYTKEYNNFKPGDIIYMRSSIATMQEIIIPYVYKHIAIVVEFNNVLYCAEASNKKVLGRFGKKIVQRIPGVDVYPLHDRLKNIIGPMFVSKLNKPLNIEKIEKMQDTIMYHLGEPYPSIVYLYIIFTLGIPIKSNMYCHTLVYECLYNMGLISTKMKSGRKIGKFITTVYNHDLNDGYKYEYPKQLIYDYEGDENDF